MGLDLRIVGRPQKLTAFVARELTEDDLGQLHLPRPSSRPPEIKKLRQRHHELARLLAQGTPEGEAAKATGYTLARVSVMKGDPAFQELMVFYGGVVDEAYRDLHDQLAAVAGDAVDELQERLDTEPESFTIPDLLKVATMGADRTGFGPKTTQEVDVRVGIADRMVQARQRAALVREERRMRDITPGAAEGGL